MQLSGLTSLANCEPTTEQARARALRRLEDFALATGKVEAYFADGRLSAGFGEFREAVNLSRGYPALEETVVKLAVAQAEQLLPQGWRIAEALLQEAGEVDSGETVPDELWDGIQQREREETINRALNAAEAASPNGRMPLARQRLAGLAAKYPGESRLETRLKTVDARSAHSREFETRGFHGGVRQQREARPEMVLVRRTATKQKQRPKTAWVRFKRVTTLISATAMLSVAGGLAWMHHAKSLAKPEAVSAARPVTTPAIATLPVEVFTPKSQTVQVVEWSGAVSGAAPVEVRRRTPFDPSRLDASLKLPAPVGNQIRAIPPPIEQPVHDSWLSAAPELPDLENRAKADEDAWAAVNRGDVHSVERYLSRSPGGANRATAEQALADIRRTEAAQQQSAEVLDVVRQYAAAWNARNVDSIVSLQRYLDRRAVRAQLSPLKSLVMNISPTSEPRIEGAQATVLCRRQVSEIFADGVEKQSPEVTVTLVLARRSGAWTIESAKQ
ncbi:MAG TPA: hypothetical protein VK604_06115 [Bryobacteraceae bacterium]|nr:hypothetical protein [Bryobacteraceae bacterium]